MLQKLATRNGERLSLTMTLSKIKRRKGEAIRLRDRDTTLNAARTGGIAMTKTRIS
jgi:hypothetical protein